MTETNVHALRKLQLKVDVALYAAGGVPSDEELARAPRLEDWHAVVGQKAIEPTLDRCMWIKGNVYNRADIRDGVRCTTTTVVWFDRHRRFVRTTNTLYALGEPAKSGGEE